MNVRDHDQNAVQQKINDDRTVKHIRTMIEIFEQNLKRLTVYKDPVTRNCVFLEKLLIILDASKGMMKHHYDDMKIPDDLDAKINKLYDIINDNIQSLIETIQQPCYSPDHPYGRELMATAKNDFENVNSN
jgi:hypothetical protein